MKHESRYLVTTADEGTWKFDRPIIFLGEWCCPYGRRDIWQNMDAIFAAPYGLGKEKKDADYHEAKILLEKLFPKLCEVLNLYHGENHDERFWRILLGHWLSRYVNVMLNRFNTLRQCLQTYNISGTTVYTDSNTALVTQNSHSAILAFNDDRWNNALIARFLNILEIDSFPIEQITGYPSKNIDIDKSAKVIKPKRNIIKYCRQRARVFLSYFSTDGDAFIINSYLPLKEEVKLQLLLGQCPQLWISQKNYEVVEPDHLLRESLASKMGRKSGNILEDALFALVFELIPICYLEGFSNLIKESQHLTWPKKPKFIFTSNNFDTDELFKIWTATKVKLGIKYFTGQHGNNYGTYRYMHPAIEEVTADKFITWGWEDGLTQHTPAFTLKTVGKKIQKYNAEGGLLLIELHSAQRLVNWDDTHEYNLYFEDQIEFVKNLDLIPKKELTIRLHSSSKKLKWCEESRWQEVDKSLKIDQGDIPIGKLISNSRIVVHSYDSTGFLETLSQNIPSLAFWQNGLDHLRDNAVNYYQLLIDVGILHLTPISIAQKVNEVWDSVDDWWGQKELQDARSIFCEKYARQSARPLHELKEILTKQSQN